MILMNTDIAAISDEDLEFLVEDLLRSKRFVIVSRPARGPDQGKDLIAEKISNDEFGNAEHLRVLVECKHYAKSKRSVREADIGNFELRMKQHKANRYLLVTTSTVSETVKNHLKAVSEDESSVRKASFWAMQDLIGLLQEHRQVRVKYLGVAHSWEEEADEAAAYVARHFFEAHRGAMLWCPGVTAVFGNDGHTHPKTQAQVERFRKALKVKRRKELAFARGTDRYSWVILVKSADAHGLHKLIWECVDEELKSRSIIYEGEQQTAARRLYSYWSKPHKPENPIGRSTV